MCSKETPSNYLSPNLQLDLGDLCPSREECQQIAKVWYISRNKVHSKSSDISNWAIHAVLSGCADGADFVTSGKAAAALGQFVSPEAYIEQPSKRPKHMSSRNLSLCLIAHQGVGHKSKGSTFNYCPKQSPTDNIH